MAERGQETVIRRNWIAWTFNFFYPLTITCLCVFIISRYFGLPIADDFARDVVSLIRNAVSLFTIWMLKLF
ncbi:hypothetical protein [Mesorhizobium sp. CN2-181]|uniref:hypothetical protein n=1 Tax=Mesorhizobium yinganensis TaxID=3157707 RepID=UPI0032B7819F